MHSSGLKTPPETSSSGVWHRPHSTVLGEATGEVLEEILGRHGGCGQGCLKTHRGCFRVRKSNLDGNRRAGGLKNNLQKNTWMRQILRAKRALARAHPSIGRPATEERNEVLGLCAEPNVWLKHPVWPFRSHLPRTIRVVLGPVSRLSKKKVPLAMRAGVSSTAPL